MSQKSEAYRRTLLRHWANMSVMQTTRTHAQSRRRSSGERRSSAASMPATDTCRKERHGRRCRRSTVMHFFLLPTHTEHVTYMRRIVFFVFFSCQSAFFCARATTYNQGDRPLRNAAGAQAAAEQTRNALI
jgi:hypothetical protein